MATEQTDTIIGANVELKGSLHNHGPIQIFGKIVGDISSDSQIFIGETAIVQGPIRAKQVEIAGQVQGTVTAESQIELQPKSVVHGDLITSRLSIKPGAVFIGTSKMMNVEEGAMNLEHDPSDKKRPRVEVQ
jgi:cytoskeletal protein CcmA (bactofilin family)